MKAIGTILIIIITSLFFFPFNSSLLPAVNTKMALAGLGLIIFALNSSRKNNAKVSITFSKVTFWAALVSFAGLISVLVNDSCDYTYASYIISAWVWMGGAYTVIKCIELVYSKVTLRLLTNILIVVCVCQCILSQIIDTNQPFADWVDSWMVSSGFMGKNEGRLYGIGCALDVAGLKFCSVLILLSYFVLHPSKRINIYFETTLYIIAFLIIAIFGSMIARTTSIGAVIVLIYWIINLFIRNDSELSKQNKYFWKVIFITLAILIPIIVYFYKTDATFYKNLRFGFEGFFSLVETGEWEVHSNNQLAGMLIWPENASTWLIGDGYFENPFNTNPYYTGSSTTDYYMGTDVGYCRFIFYFGIIGLALFCLYFINCAKCCSDNLPKYKFVIWLILIMNFIGWYKVSSDIFPIFAFLILLDKEPLQLQSEELSQTLGTTAE